MPILNRPYHLPEISVPDHDEFDSPAIIPTLPHQRQTPGFTINSSYLSDSDAEALISPGHSRSVSWPSSVPKFAVLTMFPTAEAFGLAEPKPGTVN